MCMDALFDKINQYIVKEIIAKNRNVDCHYFEFKINKKYIIFY